MSFPRCPGCQRNMISASERERNLCGACAVTGWSAEKRAAMKRLASVGFRRAFSVGPQPTDDEIDAAIDGALAVLDKEKS